MASNYGTLNLYSPCDPCAAHPSCCNPMLLILSLCDCLCPLPCACVRDPSHHTHMTVLAAHRSCVYAALLRESKRPLCALCLALLRSCITLSHYAPILALGLATLCRVVFCMLTFLAACVHTWSLSDHTVISPCPGARIA